MENGVLIGLFKSGGDSFFRLAFDRSSEFPHSYFKEVPQVPWFLSLLPNQAVCGLPVTKIERTKGGEFFGEDS